MAKADKNPPAAASADAPETAAAEAAAQAAAAGVGVDEIEAAEAALEAAEERAAAAGAKPELPPGLARVRNLADADASFSLRGHSPRPEPDGSYVVPGAALEELASHGFVLVKE